MEIIDLSRELYHRTPQYPGQPPIIHGVWKSHKEAFADFASIKNQEDVSSFNQKYGVSMNIDVSTV